MTPDERARDTLLRLSAVQPDDDEAVNFTLVAAFLAAENDAIERVADALAFTEGWLQTEKMAARIRSMKRVIP